MKNKWILMTVSIILVIAMAACNGSILLDIPASADAPDALKESEDNTNPGPEASENTVPEIPADRTSLEILQDAYISIYEQVLPSVVSISVTKTVLGSGFEFPDIPFDYDFDLPENEEPFEYQESAAGSGFIWDTDGHIITNNHVIDGADVIRVVFADGRSELAELIGADAASDLAVIKVDLPENEMVPISVSDSTQVKVGQIVIAIGNPFQLQSSMTTGIVSGIGRSLPLGSTNERGLYYSIPDVIQTDTAINPGNSGGVLVDISGGLIGVTSAIESPVRANSGVGYVIPSVIVNKIVPLLIRDGKFEQPWIGISGRDMIPEFADLMGMDSQQRGALIIDVAANSPAAEAGLIGSSIKGQIDGNDVRVGGDVIVAADDYPINDFEDLVAFLARHTIVGQTITLTMIRADEEIEVDLTLKARPETSGLEEKFEPEEISAGAWLGVEGQTLRAAIADAMDLLASTRGVLINTVTAGSPADEAGLRGSYKPVEVDGQEIMVGGDVITKVDETIIESMEDLAEIIENNEAGTIMLFYVLRSGEETVVGVTLGERPNQ